MVDERVLIFNYCKNIAKLQHSRKLVLAGTDAVAVTNKSCDIFIFIRKFYVIGFAAFNKCSVSAVNPILKLIISSLRNFSH